MGYPIKKYYGDQFFGIRPPKPNIFPMYSQVYANAIPAMSLDGSYFLLTTTSITYYNKSNTVIWTLTATTLNIGGSLTNFLSFMYHNNTYYLVGYRSGIICLVSLSNPYVNNNTSIFTSAITITNTPNTNVNSSYIIPYGSNFKLKFIGASPTLFYDLIFSTTAKVSETLITQNNSQNVTIGLYEYVSYETLDGTTQMSIYDDGSNSEYYTIMIEKNGKLITIPCTWLMRAASSAGFLTPIWLGGSIIHFICSVSVIKKGYYTVDRTDLDRWLKEITLALGL